MRDLHAYPWPAVAPGREADLLHHQALDSFNNTDLALVGRFGGPILEIAANLLGMEEWFVRVMTDPAFVTELLRRIEHICTLHDLAGLDAAGPCLSIMKVSGEDFGAQHALLYPPAIVHAVLLPALRRRWSAVRRRLEKVNRRTKIMLHSCGAIRPLIGHLIDAGIDILDPVQPLATDMSARELQAEFGGRIAFHGGVDVQRLLPRGTPEQVHAETTRVMTDFDGLHGGVIIAPSHTVQADTPPENIAAMADAVREYR